MPKPKSGQTMLGHEATSSDLHQILGDMDDSTAVAKLAFHPPASPSSKSLKSGSTEQVTSSARNIARLMAWSLESLTCSPLSRKTSRGGRSDTSCLVIGHGVSRSVNQVGGIALGL